MSVTLIQNTTGGPLPLPYPMRGILRAGQRIVLPRTATVLRDAVPGLESVCALTELSGAYAGPFDTAYDLAPVPSAELPDTPANVLLDFANAGKAIILDPVTGAGLALPVATLLEGATGEATETAASGDWLVGDGAGGAQLASAAPGDVRAVLGIASTTTLAVLAGLVSTTTSVGHDVVGYARIDPTGVTEITFEALGRAVSGVTGTLVLYDLDASQPAATLTWTEGVPTRKTASVTVPGGATRYELRASKSGGNTHALAAMGGANLLITRS
jgi:hypothetical protein